MILETRGITKRFGAMCALDGISIAIRKGEFHALVGENGAGKSTLIKILTGVYHAGEGAIVWQGKPVSLPNPRSSMDIGITVIHQERNLIPSFTVVENVYLGTDYEKRGIAVDWKKMKDRVNRLMDELSIHIPVDVPARLLSPPQRTQTEIIRAMMNDSKLLILDEPTSALTDQEASRLFQILKNLQNRGTAILYVSHRLDEIMALSNRITVLQNGRLVKTLETAGTTKDGIISLMTGAWSAEASGPARPSPGDCLLEVKGLSSADGIVKGVDLAARAGEIVGLFGLGGSGRTETLECIYGSRAASGGNVRLGGTAYSRRAPAASIRRGLAMIAEDRRGKALVTRLSVKENTVLSVLDNYSRWGFINDRAQERDTAEQIASLSIKTAGPSQAVEELSGGNQQKVAFAKAIMSSPRVILCDEPTQAVDVKTRREIHSLLRTMAARGRAVVFVSSDLKETLELADRIQIIARGKSGDCFDNKNLSAEQVLGACYAD